MKKQVMLFFLMIISLTVLVSAIPLPHAFYGEIYYSDGVLIGESLELIAEIDGVETRSVIRGGLYDLVVESDNGGIIYFYIDGLIEAIGTNEFESFAVTELDFVTSLINPNPSGTGGSSGRSSGGGGGGSEETVDNDDSNIQDSKEDSLIEFQKLNSDNDYEKVMASEDSKITGNVVGFTNFKTGMFTSVFLALIILLGIVIWVVNGKK